MLEFLGNLPFDSIEKKYLKYKCLEAKGFQNTEVN